jgi:hypothetical protein
LLLSHPIPPPSDKQYEEEEILWRQIIIGFYCLHLNIPPEMSYKTEEMFQGWYGNDGLITHIMGKFGLVGDRDRRRIKRVANVKEWASRGVLYKGLRIKGQCRKPMICSPQEYQILIDSMESGYGLVTTIHQINDYRVELDLLDVGYTTVCRTMKRLDPVIRKIRRRRQGKRDPISPWAKAILRWVTQLLVRIGTHNFYPAAQENEHLQLTKTSPYFDRLLPLSLHQIVFFDECH